MAASAKKSRNPATAEAQGKTREETEYDLAVKDCKGVNTQATRTSIAENEFAWLENIMPIGYGNMRIVPFQGTAVATITTSGVKINYWNYFNIANTDYMFCGASDGSAYQLNLDTYAVTTIATAGTFTTPIDTSQWANSELLIITANGYYAWNGSALQRIDETVFSVTINQPGTGYTGVPALAFTGGGATTQATATAILGTPAATLAGGGTGYFVNDILTLVGGTSTVKAQIQVTQVSGGVISAFTIINSGNYTVIPSNNVAVTGGFGTGATFTVQWGVVGVTALTPGAGYTSVPAIGVSGGSGSGAQLTANLSIAPSVGQTIATFSGRVWIGDNRTVIFSAPGSYTDFSTADAGGSFVMTDETLISNIEALLTANNYLYIVGASSFNIVSNVVVSGTPAVTQFSNTPISSLIGTNLPLSIFPYYRAIAFATKYGFYALNGATPQKISDALDGVVPLINFANPVSGGIANIFDILCAAFLFTYMDPVVGARPLIALFFNKKWFFASQGPALSLIGSAFVNGVPTLFGTDGQRVYNLFSDNIDNVASKIVTALWPLKKPTHMKEALKFGVEVTNTSLSPVLNVSLDSDFGSYEVELTAANDGQWENEEIATGQWFNAFGVVGNWVNSSAQQGGWYYPTSATGELGNFFNNAGTQGGWTNSEFQIYQLDSESKGRYLGLTITSTAPDFLINGLIMQYQMSAPWAVAGDQG